MEGRESPHSTSGGSTMFVHSSLPRSAPGLVPGALAAIAFAAATVLNSSLAAQVGPASPSRAVEERAPRAVSSLGANAGAVTGRAVGCYHCYDMDEQHFASALYPFSEWGPGDGSHFWRAYDGVCLFVHGVCIYLPEQAAATPRELTDAVADAVAREDVAALANLLATSPVQVFAERDAIQVLACDGVAIAGHIPVQRNLLRSIQAAFAEIDSDR